MINDLQIILCLTYLTNAGLSMFLAGSGRNFKGAWLWVIAQILMALGTVGDALPIQAPSWIPFIVGNSAYAAASVLYSHSVWVFRFKPRFPRWLYGMIALQVITFCAAFTQPYLTRTLVFSAWMSIGPLVTAALLLWKVERRFWFPNTLTALPFLFLGLASISRLIVLSILSNKNEVSYGSQQNIWYMAGAILLSTITLFGYFMMSWLQTVQVLSKKDKEIEARNAKLVEAGRSKDLFFAIVAHDLRGPIGGAARYVRKHLFANMSGLESKYAEVETLALSLDKTYEFLEKLLWWSRSQLEGWAPAKIEISLEQCLKHAVELIQSRSSLKNNTIRLAPPPYPRICADPESVQVILNNLLSNAVKYSQPGGEIRIGVREEAGYCRIDIEDEGVGMDQTTLDRLFRIEDKLSTLGTSQEMGNGLGLILAKSLAERNDGRITLESQLGSGTRASLVLPCSGCC